MNNKDKKYWIEFMTSTHEILQHDEYMQVCEIYARIKNKKAFYPCKSCGSSGPILQGYINEINLEFKKQ